MTVLALTSRKVRNNHAQVQVILFLQRTEVEPLRRLN